MNVNMHRHNLLNDNNRHSNNNGTHQINSVDPKTCIASEQRYANRFNTANISIDNVNLWALIDTGADINALSLQAYELLPPRHKLNSNVDEYTTASGSKLNVIGFVILNTVLNGKTVNVKYHVIKDLAHAVVLGTPFFRATNTVIDCTGDKIKVRPVSTLRSGREIVIPPYTEQIETIHLNNNIPNGMLGISSGNKLQQVGIFVAQSINRVSNNKVNVRLLNATPNSRTIYKNSRIGIFESLAHDSTVSTYDNNKHINAMNSDSETEINSSKEFNIDKSNLSEEQQHELKQMLYSYKDVFIEHAGKLGYTDIIKHQIKIPYNVKPIKSRPYKANPNVRVEIDKQIQSLLDQDIIEPGNGA